MENKTVFNENGYYSAADTTENTKISEITLEECFKNITEGKCIEFELENLNKILKKDLQVNFYYLKPKLKYVMPYMLVHFIKCWPGWQKSGNYLNKQISFSNWFTKFKEYLVFKINYLIKNDYEKVVDMIKTNTPIEDSVLIKIDNSTQISVPKEKAAAPYAIQIQGTPKMLNSLLFSGGPEDSIIVREYKAKSFNTKLTTKQLVNWPYVEVEFASKELNFKRKNMHEFKRCLMLCNEKITFMKIENLIEEIKIVDEQISRSVYTLNVLREYCDTYVDILRRHQQIMKISDEYITDIKTIFDEFVTDIKELNMNSMATNTSVLFNIGHFVYARNKSVRTSGQPVSFAESITPKVNVSLFLFTGLKDEESDTPFQELQNLLDSTDKDFIKTHLPTLKFKCTYCNVCCGGKVDLLDHFKLKHCMEQPVLCFRCKMEMDVPKICSDRWSHDCGNKNNVQVVPR